jgi:hypothetical protein
MNGTLKALRDLVMDAKMPPRDTKLYNALMLIGLLGIGTLVVLMLGLH